MYGFSRRNVPRYEPVSGVVPLDCRRHAAPVLRVRVGAYGEMPVTRVCVGNGASGVWAKVPLHVARGVVVGGVVCTGWKAECTVQHRVRKKISGPL